MRKENSTNNENRKALADYCGMNYAHDLISGRWKMLILYKLGKQDLRYTELKKQMPNITERMLSLTLKELEHAGLIERLLVGYGLSAAGRALQPIWLALEQWGDAHRKEAEL